MSSAKACLLALLLTAAACTPSAPEHTLVPAENGVVRIPLEELAREQVLFRTFKHEGKNVNFLVRTDGEGAVHVHLDACYSCWQYRRGFVVEDAAVVCIACRLSYPLEEPLWDFIGACAPIPIRFAIEKDDLVLRQTVLERAARYF